MATPRNRNYAAEYARRQQLARERGHGSYYEQRIRGGAAAKPTAKRPTGETLRQRAGHGKFRAFLRDVQPGALVVLGTHTGDKGWDTVPILIYTDDGEEIEYEFEDLTEDELDWLLGEIYDRDADYTVGTP